VLLPSLPQALFPLPAVHLSCFRKTTLYPCTPLLSLSRHIIRFPGAGCKRPETVHTYPKNPY
ncbi:MAG TPA: hypothetical protein PKW71_04775, partial [Anaerohalosphaeraceae bacterium]|nr:hypothetical protein [Anaerohalosphaeraceae bacterium]